MASFSPSVTNNSGPAYLITMAGALTYPEFLNMIGVNVYNIKGIFVQTPNNFNQLTQPLTFNARDSSGTRFQSILKPRTDPYQNQSSILLDNGGGSMILNGLSTLSFALLPFQTVSFSFCMDEKSIADAMNYISASNPMRNTDTLGNLALFVDQNNEKCLGAGKIPNITITNLSAVTQQIVLFNSSTPDTAVYSRYLWDVSCEGFAGETVLSLQARAVGAIPYTNYVLPIVNDTIEGVVALLNTLGLGAFGYTVDNNGSQYIFAFSATYQFGALNLSNPGPGIDTDYVISSFLNTTGGMQYFANCTELNNLLNPQDTTDAWNHPVGTLIKVIFTGGNVLAMGASVVLDGVGTIFDQIVNTGEQVTFSFSILDITTKYYVYFIETS